MSHVACPSLIVSGVFDLISTFIKNLAPRLARPGWPKPHLKASSVAATLVVSMLLELPKIKLELETAGTDQLAGVAVHM